MKRALKLILAPVGLCVLLNGALVSAHSLDCEMLLSGIKPFTMRALRKQNTANLAQEQELHPRRNFRNLKQEIANEQVGVLAPRAIQDFLGNEKLINTPVPYAELDTAVKHHMEGQTVPVHVDRIENGQRSSTAMYVSLPKTLKPLAPGQKLLRKEEYPLFIVHLHGGGTRTASGPNAAEIAKALSSPDLLMSQRVPVVGIDMPGHGRATCKIDGLTGMREQLDWILKMVDEIADTEIPFIIEGHSWGAEDVVWLHAHSNDPKYKRIMHLIALSPPVDVSLGGDENLKYEREDWIEQNFPQLKARSAAKDYEFMENIVRNLKINAIGSLFTTFTDMDYRLPPLSAEEQVNLKPMLVIQPTKDLMTYVGREREFHQYFDRLVYPSEVYMMGPGRTWQSLDKEVDTGHNPWDRYIDDTTTLEAYDRIKGLAWHYMPQGSGEDRNDEAGALMDRFVRQYANFFLFRELVKDHVEYITLPTADRSEMANRKVAIDTYIKSALDDAEKFKKKTDERVAAAHEALRGELGFTEPITIDRVRDELAQIPPSPERRAELTNYVTTLDEMERNLRKNWFDPEAEKVKADLQAKYGSMFAELGIAEMSQYEPVFKEWLNRKVVDAKEKNLRSKFNKFHEAYLANFRATEARFNVERERIQAQVPKPEGVTDRRAAARAINTDFSPARRQRLQAYFERYSVVEARVREEARIEQEAQLAASNHIAGVTSVEQALKAKAEQDSLFNFTFVPEGHPEITQVAERVRELTQARTALLEGDAQNSGLEKQEKALRDEQVKRQGLQRKWDALWDKKLLSSAKLVEALETVEQKLDRLTDLHHSYSRKNRDRIHSLKRAGQLTEHALTDGQPLELTRLAEEELSAEDAYSDALKKIEPLRWQEALAGNLTGKPEVVAEAVKIAKLLWGESYPDASAGSLLASLRQHEDEVESVRQRESVLRQALEHSQWEYSQKMLAAGLKLPHQIERVDIAQFLNRPAAEVLAAIRSQPHVYEAFRRTLSLWDPMLKQLRVESETKDSGVY